MEQGRDAEVRVSILHTLSLEHSQMVQAEQRRAHPAVAAYPTKPGGGDDDYRLSFALMMSYDHGDTFKREAPAIEGVYRSEASCLARSYEVEGSWPNLRYLLPSLRASPLNCGTERTCSPSCRGGSFKGRLFRLLGIGRQGG